MNSTTRWLIGASLGFVVTGGGAAPSLQDQRQAASYADAQRLCGQYAPDIAKVTACMKPKKALVSRRCRAFWDMKS